MNKKDQQIRALEIQIEDLQAELAERDEIIEDLESRLYKAEMHGTGITGGWQDIVDKADQDRAAFQNEIKALKAEIERLYDRLMQYAPATVINPVITVNDADEIPEGRAAHLFNLPTPEITEAARKRGLATFDLSSHVIWLDVRIGARYGNAPDNFRVYTVQGTYYAALESVITEITQPIVASLVGAPLYEELGSSWVFEVIPKQTLNDIMRELTVWRHNASFIEKNGRAFTSQIGRIFDEKAWPLIQDKHEDHSDMKRQFTQQVKRAFERYDRTNNGPVLLGDGKS